MREERAAYVVEVEAASFDSTTQKQQGIYTVSWSCSSSSRHHLGSCCRCRAAEATSEELEDKLVCA